MGESESVKMIRRIRRELYEEEERLGREEFRRRQRERVNDFIKGKRIEVVPLPEAERSS